MTIQELRENIDRIDQQIVQLYCERMETARPERRAVLRLRGGGGWVGRLVPLVMMTFYSGMRCIVQSKGESGAVIGVERADYQW